MDRKLVEALITGGERVAAWADLLDEINVFPVADGDTGRNLKISLAPLGRAREPAAVRCRQLVSAATGNSGNIAVAFLVGFLTAIDRQPFNRAVSAGRDAAWKAVASPKTGTMLTVFDALDGALSEWPAMPQSGDADRVVQALDAAVRSTPESLPELRSAGVVDAGALAMFIFFEGLLNRLFDGGSMALPAVAHRFGGMLRVTGTVGRSAYPGYCVNTILAPSPDTAADTLTDGLGESVVAVPDGDRLRLHVHTCDKDDTRSRLSRLGEVVDWQVEPLAADETVPLAVCDEQAVHVMTDAAGSLTREDARRLGITLLDSYLLMDESRIPETLADPLRLYDAMATGRPVSTAQASAFQKHQSYESAVGRHRHVLYLAVGSVYTGNVATANRWREKSGHAGRFTVMDTGSASGRLGLIARLVARFARSAESVAAVAAFAGDVTRRCGELLFLDQLKFLAAGGRISKSRGFFGDFLGIKPVISPRPEGAVKVGTVRTDEEQVAFALDYLKSRFSDLDRLTLLLQFSDNRRRVSEIIRPVIQKHFPRAEILIGPLSLTSGAHMGPGTWGVAFCPEPIAA